MPGIAMVEGMTAEFVLLAGKFIQVNSRENFSGGSGAAKQAEGSVISTQVTVIPKNASATIQSGARKIIEGKGDERR
jgi:hypothetical protein